MSAPPPLRHPGAIALRAAALRYPQTEEHFPWDHHAFKVAGKKTFLFLTGLEEGFNCSMKLPYRNGEALKLKAAAPTGYGMGASGWVTLTFSPSGKPPMTKLHDWLDESWRAVAPKKLSASFPDPPPKGGK